ncbi:CLUMA_CG011563, isoform A [Clunio marinus]|uniref:CLUMA_CG011563, isoform A n=1 Tax=Clunio marinus TaxID=568069 RepID=A0A1J1IDA8_9DIPT|nr:CLUMA_CG011563, isoform A [Clunio marinus]
MKGGIAKQVVKLNKLLNAILLTVFGLYRFGCFQRKSLQRQRLADKRSVALFCLPFLCIRRMTSVEI